MECDGFPKHRRARGITAHERVTRALEHPDVLQILLDRKAAVAEHKRTRRPRRSRNKQATRSKRPP